MNTRKKTFEQLNYPADTSVWVNLAKISVVGVIIVAGLYVGHHYYYGCSDWLVKGCAFIAK